MIVAGNISIQFYLNVENIYLEMISVDLPFGTKIPDV